MKVLALGILSGVVVTFSSVLAQTPASSPPPTDGIKELIDNQRVFICEVALTKGQNWPMQQYDQDVLMGGAHAPGPEDYDWRRQDEDDELQAG